MDRSTRIVIAETEVEMGQLAGSALVDLLEQYTVRRGVPVVLNLAAAPSQDASYRCLVERRSGIDWCKVHAIHLDEYIDLPRGHPHTFEQYLRHRVYGPTAIPEEHIHTIKGVQQQLGENAFSDVIAEVYGRVATDHIARARSAGGVLIAHIGIGVNGHIAFNEPHVDKWTRDFAIPVEIDDVSVRQQYDDYKDHVDPAARYASIADVPRRAVPVSVGGILESDHIVCVVPGSHKADAVAASLDGPLTETVAGSLLRTAADVRWFLTQDSAAKLTPRRPTSTTPCLSN